MRLLSKRKRNKRNKFSVESTHDYYQIYSKKDYENDSKTFDNGIVNGKLDLDSFQRLMIQELCSNTKILDTGFIGHYKLEDVQTAIKFPRNNWKVLLTVSEELMRSSPHYYRLNSFYSNMAVFCWGLDLYDVKNGYNAETLRKTYNALSAKLESMNLKHEFSKIMKFIPYQDVFCGVVMENDTGFFIQQMDLRICELYQVQDGLYNFRLDLSAIKPNNLQAYPDYIQKEYLNFTDNKLASRWYIPPFDKQICIKLNSQWKYPFPILIGLISDILDLNIYKKLKLQSARTDNYKAIMFEVPIDEKSVDKPLLTPETLGVFARMNRENMNDDIGIIHSLGSKAQSISFKDSSNTRNNVADAVEELYNSSGETKELYNGSSSGTAVTLSIENDSGFIYSLYRQFERWTNRFIKSRKYNKTMFKFHFYILDVTIFNRDTVIKRYKDAISLGATVIDKWMASLDMTPSRIMGSYVTHDIIYDFQNHFKPLESSYNSSSSSGEAGRPTNASNGELLTESGEQTADSDANKNR